MNSAKYRKSSQPDMVPRRRRRQMWAASETDGSEEMDVTDGERGGNVHYQVADTPPVLITSRRRGSGPFSSPSGWMAVATASREMWFLGASINFLALLSSYTALCRHGSPDIVFPWMDACTAEESEAWKCSKEEGGRGTGARLYSWRLSQTHGSRTSFLLSPHILINHIGGLGPLTSWD